MLRSVKSSSCTVTADLRLGTVPVQFSSAVFIGIQHPSRVYGDLFIKVQRTGFYKTIIDHRMA